MAFESRWASRRYLAAVRQPGMSIGTVVFALVRGSSLPGKKPQSSGNCSLDKFAGSALTFFLNCCGLCLFILARALEAARTCRVDGDNIMR